MSLAAIILCVSAVAGLLAGLGKCGRLLWKAMNAVVEVGEAMPTLLIIAEQFKPNGGNSLHDQITAIRTEQVKVAAALIKTEALDSRLSDLESEVRHLHNPTPQPVTVSTDKATTVVNIAGGASSGNSGTGVGAGAGNPH